MSVVIDLKADAATPAPKAPPANGRHHIEVDALFRSEDVKHAVLHDFSPTAASVTMNATTGTIADHFRQFAESSSDVVLLDIDLENAFEIEGLEAFLRKNPGKPVVVTAANASVEGLRLLMRMGVRDVVPHPVTVEALQEALQAAARPVAPAIRNRETGTVLCFLKSSGGAGTTTLATQGACALAASAAAAAKKRRSKADKPSTADKTDVCLIDLDVQFGGVALQLDLDVTTTVIDLLAKSQHIDGSMVRTAVQRHRSGVDVLPAPTTVQNFDLIQPHAVVRLIQAARSEYGHVIVDLPHAWTAWTRAVLENASGIVMVLRPTVPSIRQARRQIETLVEENLGDVPLTLVANHVERRLFGRSPILKDAERALDHQIAYTVSENAAAMAEAANAGLLLTEVRGGRRLWREVTDVMTRLMAAARAADRPIASLAD